MFTLNSSFELLKDLINIDVIKSFYVKPDQSQNQIIFYSYISVLLNLTSSIAIIFSLYN